MDVTQFLTRADEYVNQNQTHWSLTRDIDFETVNHVVRVWVQRGDVTAHRAEIDALCSAQHEDGGWGDRRDEPESRVRSSSFCCQMLLRSNRALRDQVIADVVRRGLNFIAGRQDPDGGWTDKRWHRLDATSVSIGTLIFGVRDAEPAPPWSEALDRGMRFIGAQMAVDGLWYHKPSSSPVEITAHLLQKVTLHDPASDLIAPAMRGLLALQDPAGHWDAQDVDSTCDAVRCLMLSTECPGGAELYQPVADAADRAIAWLTGCQDEEGGLGVREGRPARVLYTCDGIDTALKYQTFVAAQRRLEEFYR